MQLLLILITSLATMTLSLSAKNIGILIGTPQEEAKILNYIKNVKKQNNITTGNLAKHKIFICLTGIGKINAAIKTQMLISETNVDLIISTGLANTIDEKLNIGDIIIGTNAFQHDYGFLNKDNLILRRPGKMPELGLGKITNSIYFDISQYLDFKINDIIKLAKNISLNTIKTKHTQYMPQIKKGIIASGDMFLAATSKRQFLSKYKTSVVDMTGAAVAQVAHNNNIPVILIRSVAKKANRNAQFNFNKFIISANAKNNAQLTNKIISDLITK